MRGQGNLGGFAPLWQVGFQRDLFPHPGQRIFSLSLRSSVGDGEGAGRGVGAEETLAWLYPPFKCP